MIIIGIIVSIIIFSIIVVVHEYGHYKTAKIFGIHVEEFGLGIPPRAKKLWKNKEGTLFSLNWIPLGGFVKITGESEIHLKLQDKKGVHLSLESLLERLKKDKKIFHTNGSELSKIERKYLQGHLKSYRPGKNFFEKNIWKKSLVLLAGVIMNFLLAAIIFSVMFMIGVKPLGINTFIPTELPSKLIPTLEESITQGIIIKEPGIILSPLADSIAEKAGIQSGSELLSVNGISISSIEQAQEVIQNLKDAPSTFSLRANISECSANENCVSDYSVELTPNTDGKIGTYLSPNYQVNREFEYNYSFLDSIKYGTLETYYQARLTLSGLGILLGDIFRPEKPEDREEALEQVAGPIGIVGVITSALAGGFSLLILFGAIISVNLGVFNLLPIPALDGGRLLLLWLRTGLEKLFGKRSIFVNIENSIHIFFFLTLILLSILIAYNDVINIFSR